MFGEGSAYERGMVNGLFPTAISIAVLAAVLINVAWNMAGFSAIKTLLKGQKSDICVFLVTFFITIFVDLTVAILEKTGMADKLGRENIYDNINSALNRARELIGTEAKSKPNEPAK